MLGVQNVFMPDTIGASPVRGSARVDHGRFRVCEHGRQRRVRECGCVDVKERLPQRVARALSRPASHARKPASGITTILLRRAASVIVTSGLSGTTSGSKPFRDEEDGCIKVVLTP